MFTIKHIAELICRVYGLTVVTQLQLKLKLTLTVRFVALTGHSTNGIVNYFGLTYEKVFIGNNNGQM
jgi:hypothetical protein